MRNRLENELAILAAFIFNKTSDLSIITPEFFVTKEGILIASLIATVVDKDITKAHEIIETKLMYSYPQLYYKLLEHAHSLNNQEMIQQLIQNKEIAARARLGRLYTTIGELIARHDKTVNEILEEIEERLLSLRTIYATTDTLSGKDAIKSFIEQVKKVEEGEYAPLYTTPFSAVNKALGGGFARNARLHIIGGFSGEGKSMFAIQLAAHIANTYPHTIVMFYSLELDLKEIGNRLARALTQGKLPPDILRRTAQGEFSHKQIYKAIKSINPEILERIIFSTNFVTNINQIITDVEYQRSHFKDYELVVIVDYLQLLQIQKDPVVEYGNIARELKLMSVRTNSTVFALTQYGREAERRRNHARNKQSTRLLDYEPSIADIKWASAIAQHADSVSLMWRVLSEEDETRPELAPPFIYTGFKVEKNRTGKSNTKGWLAWDRDAALFIEKEITNQDVEDYIATQFA